MSKSFDSVNICCLIKIQVQGGMGNGTRKTPISKYVKSYCGYSNSSCGVLRDGDAASIVGRYNVLIKL